jgi:ABC-type amino acid transport substrate-binding protein
MTRKFFTFFIGALLTSSMAAATSAALGTKAPDALPALRLSMSGAFQPFSTTDADGNLVGFDADMARELARRMNHSPELIQTDWAGIQAGLQAGKTELICASMANIMEGPVHVLGKPKFPRLADFLSTVQDTPT